MAFFAVLGCEKTKPIQSQFISVQRSEFCGLRQDEEKELFREKNLLFQFLGSFRYIFDGKYRYADKTVSILCRDDSGGGC